MFKQFAKKVIRNLGYELTRRRVRDIRVDDVNSDEKGETKKFSIIRPGSDNKNLVGKILELGDHLVIESSSGHKDLSIDAIYKEPGRWGFVQCHAGDLTFLMFLGGKDDGVALRFLHNGYYEKKTMNLWVQAAKGARMVLDVGAHTGSYTISAKLSNPNAVVLSFEPHYLNYSRLSLNLRANGLGTDQVYILAVSDSNKKSMFSVPRGSDYHSSGGYVGVGDDRENYIVTCLSLDSFIDERFYREIDLIKIDTEGHEINCLSGMQKIINANFPTIFFECIAKPNERLERMILEFGYKLFLVNDSTGEVGRVSSVYPIFDSNGNLLMSSINRIALHPSRDGKLI